MGNKYLKLIIFLLLGFSSCSLGAKDKYIKIDNNVFCCDLVNTWTTSKNLLDGEKYNGADKCWHRFEPKDRGTIAIWLYENYPDKILRRYMTKDCIDDVKYPNQCYHSKYKLKSMYGESKYTVEEWVFLKDNNMVVVSYQYQNELSEEILSNGYKEIEVTLNSLKMK